MSHLLASLRPHVVVLAALAAVLATATTADAATIYAPTFGGGSGLEVRPRNWTSGGVGSSAYMEDLTWRRWGTRVARGTGTARLNDCTPSCAGGTVHYFPGRLVLSRPATCQGADGRRRMYRRASYRVKLPEDNPFGRPAGWSTTVFSTPASGPCERSHVQRAGAPRGLNRVAVGGAFVVRPAAMGTEGLGVFDETSFAAEQLRWERWGVTARASGAVTHCVVDDVPCATATGTVDLGGLVRWGCGDGVMPFEYYSRARFRVQRGDGTDADSGWVPLAAAQPPC